MPVTQRCLLLNLDRKSSKLATILLALLNSSVLGIHTRDSILLLTYMYVCTHYSIAYFNVCMYA